MIRSVINVQIEIPRDIERGRRRENIVRPTTPIEEPNGSVLADGCHSETVCSVCGRLKAAQTGQ
jgi:hypothetical protein